MLRVGPQHQVIEPIDQPPVGLVKRRAAQLLAMHQFKVGDYARNVESRWLGKIRAIKTGEVKVDDTMLFTETTAEMVGVDELAMTISGLPIQEALCEDDVQWHDVKDLMLITV
jgi:hypothetical protein